MRYFLLLLSCCSLLSSCTGFAVSGKQQGGQKTYMGRTIAPVMGHEGASWLERSDREAEERTDLLIANLGLRPGDKVADFGAGTGYFTFRMAKLVPQGQVLAVDIQPEMLAEINHLKDISDAPNVRTIQSEECDPKLPKDSVDLVLLVDVYHELSCPREVATALINSLKPGGRIALVEYRGEDPTVPIKPLHKMTEAQARKEWDLPGLRWLETKKMLPQQHLIIFQKES